MRTALIVLCGILALQTLCADAAERKGKRSKGPLLTPWIQSHKKYIQTHSIGKNKPARNISQAILAGDSEGCSMPWFAHLIVDNYICGGALISNRHVVSVAACVNFPTDPFKLYLGAYSEDQPTERIEFDISENDFWMHEDYNEDLDTDEIVLIKLPSDVTSEATISPISVWPGYKDWSGTAATFAGYGGNWNPDDPTDWVIPSGLADKTQAIQTNDFCQTELEDYYDEDMHFCTVNTGEASGATDNDEGGPLFVYDETEKPWLIGLVSFQQFSVPEVDEVTKHARLSYYLCWLQETSNNELDLAETDFCTGEGDFEGFCDFRRNLAMKQQKVMALKQKKIQKTKAQKAKNQVAKVHKKQIKAQKAQKAQKSQKGQKAQKFQKAQKSQKTKKTFKSQKTVKPNKGLKSVPK